MDFKESWFKIWLFSELLICNLFFFRHYILSQNQMIQVSRKLAFFDVITAWKDKKIIFFWNWVFQRTLFFKKQFHFRVRCNVKFSTQKLTCGEKINQYRTRCKNPNSKFDELWKVGWKTDTFSVSRFKIGRVVKKLFQNIMCCKIVDLKSDTLLICSSQIPTSYSNCASKRHTFKNCWLKSWRIVKKLGESLIIF